MSKKVLGLDIDSLINEAISNIFESESDANVREKLKQQTQIKNKNRRKKIYSGKENAAADESEESSIEPKKPTKISHEKLPEITVKEIRNKIDNIRSGKSLKDSQTKEALKQYFEKLNGPERVALFAFLTGLEKILLKQSSDGKTPHQTPYSVDMEQHEEVESGKKPKAKPQGTKHISSTKNSETPIVVGERADIRLIKSKLWR